MAEEKEHFITVSQLQRITKLPLSTLRYYETEFPSYLRVHKTGGGHRRYSPENVERFLHLKELIQEKQLSIKDVKRSLAPDEDPARLREELDLLLAVTEELTKQNMMLRESMEELAKRLASMEDELRAKNSRFKWFK